MTDAVVHVRAMPLGIIAQKYGAWPWGDYKLDLHGNPGSPLAYGIIGAKRELVAIGKGQFFGSGLGLGIDLTPTFGPKAVASTKILQSKLGITSDGILGPITARHMLRWRIYAVESTHQIPDHRLARLISLESGYGFGAISPDLDRGLAQINSLSQNQVIDAEAYDASFAIPWAGDRMREAYDQLHDWDAAVFAHNAPAFADDWLRAGKPSTGGPLIRVGDTTYPMFTWASMYVGSVMTQTL